jgi:hypothetical protein
MHINRKSGSSPLFLQPYQRVKNFGTDYDWLPFISMFKFGSQELVDTNARQIEHFLFSCLKLFKDQFLKLFILELHKLGFVKTE